MDPLTFASGDAHLRVDRGVFELFDPAAAPPTSRVAALADRRVG